MIIANAQNISNLIGCEEYNISRIALFYKKKYVRFLWQEKIEIHYSKINQ